MKRVLVINGPNLNLLGTRETDVYGALTLEEICEKIRNEANEIGIVVDFFQSNHEGELIDKIHLAKGVYMAIIINPGAFTHYSYAIRDAIKAVEVDTLEVHLSNIHSREEFRKVSVVAPVCLGQISGFGANSYLVALKAVSLL